MMTVEQQLNIEARQRREQDDRELCKKQNAARVRAAQEWADRQNAMADQGIELAQWQKRESKLINYSESVVQHSIGPLTKERFELLADTELTGTDHRKRLKEIDGHLADLKKQLSAINSELAELQPRIKERLLFLRANKSPNGELH